MPGPGRRQRLPRRGDKKIDHRFLEEASDRIDHFNRLTVSGGGLSNGPSGPTIIIPEAPDPPPGLILCDHGWLPAAFGGVSGDYPFDYPDGDLAYSYGNRPDDITTRRRVYFRTVNQVGYKHKGASGPPAQLSTPPGPIPGVGYLVNISEDEEPFVRNVQLANPFGLPINTGYSWATPVDPFNPDDPHYLVLQPLAPNPWGGLGVSMGFSDPPYDGWPLPHDTPQFLKGGWATADGVFNSVTTGIVVPGYADLFLPYPGYYKVTFGIEAYGPGLYTNEVTGEAAPGIHTHTYKGYSTPTLTFRLVKNHEPGTAIDFGSSIKEDQTLLLPLPSGGYGGPFGGVKNSAEKTITIRNDSGAWHGGPYTRLSFAVKTYLNTSAENYDSSVRVRITRIWVHIEPCPNYVNSNRGGCGCQQWPDGYTWPAGGTFQWWGGGPAPQSFDENGVGI